ncbi:uncharacterized protein LOC100182830 isoform X2 [Ciona intestinalis]
MVGMDNMLDLTYLTESERKWISEVLERDEEIQKREDARIERLKSKAMRTNNPTIRKKISMRTGQWFLDLADKDKNFKNRGVDTVRASIRRKGKDRPKPASPVATQITELVEKDENQFAEAVNNGAQEEEISYFSQVHRNYGDDASGDESYENEELRNQGVTRQSTSTTTKASHTGSSDTSNAILKDTCVTKPKLPKTVSFNIPEVFNEMTLDQNVDLIQQSTYIEESMSKQVVEEPIVVVDYFAQTQQQTVPVEPVVEQTIPDEPVVKQTIPDEPVVEQTIPDEPLVEQTIPDEPVVKQTIPDEPVVEKTIPDEPVVEQTIPDEPVVEQTIPDEPVVEQTITDEPVVEQTIPDEPVVEQTIPVEPVVEQTIPVEPVVEQTISDEPVVEQTIPDEPVVEQTIPVEPVVEQTTFDEPVVEQTIPDEPVVEQTIPDEPVIEQTISDEPVVKQTIPDEPVIEQTISDELVVEQTIPDEPVVEQTIPDEPVVEQTIPDEPVVEQTIPDEPVGEQTIPDEPVVKQTIPDEPVVEQTIPVEPVVERTIPDEPVVEQTIPDEPVVEQTIPDEPVVEQTISAEPVVEQTIPDEPVVEQTISDEPVVEQTIPDEPVVEQTIPDEPVGEQTIPVEPVVEQTITVEPVVEQTIPVEPVVEQTIPDEPVVEQTIPDEPVVEQTIPDEPVVEQTIPDEPVVEQTIPDEPVVEQTIPDEPVVEQTIPDEPVGEQTIPDEPVVEQTIPDEPVVEQTIPDEPIVEQTIPDEPVVEQTIPDEPVVEQTIPDEPVVEQTIPDEPILEQTIPDEPLVEQTIPVEPPGKSSVKIIKTIKYGSKKKKVVVKRKKKDLDNISTQEPYEVISPKSDIIDMAFQPVDNTSIQPVPIEAEHNTTDVYCEVTPTHTEEHTTEITKSSDHFETPDTSDTITVYPDEPKSYGVTPLETPTPPLVETPVLPEDPQESLEEPTHGRGIKRMGSSRRKRVNKDVENDHLPQEEVVNVPVEIEQDRKIVETAVAFQTDYTPEVIQNEPVVEPLATSTPPSLFELMPASQIGEHDSEMVSAEAIIEPDSYTSMVEPENGLYQKTPEDSFFDEQPSEIGFVEPELVPMEPETYQNEPELVQRPETPVIQEPAEEIAQPLEPAVVVPPMITITNTDPIEPTEASSNKERKSSSSSSSSSDSDNEKKSKKKTKSSDDEKKDKSSSDDEKKDKSPEKSANGKHHSQGSLKKKKTSLGGSLKNLTSVSKLSKSRESLGSTWSVYSGTSAFAQSIDVTGSVEFGMKYSHKTGSLNINIVGCSDLAAVDEKKLSNPYVKTYLLPDKQSKRKTKAKKKTINPVYNETLKYIIPESELSTRTLNVAVWHDKVGVNVFLGEVNLELNFVDFSDPRQSDVYVLQPKVAFTDFHSNTYNGDMSIALRYIQGREKFGQLEIVVQGVRNLPAAADNSNIFVKGYFLPDKARATKQKTPLLQSSSNVQFDHQFVYTKVASDELSQRCIEITVWKEGLIGPNKLLGAVRLSTGTGQSFGDNVPWMDSTTEEIQLWQKMFDNFGSWSEGTITLRNIKPST